MKAAMTKAANKALVYLEKSNTWKFFKDIRSLDPLQVGCLSKKRSELTGVPQLADESLVLAAEWEVYLKSAQELKTSVPPGSVVVSTGAVNGLLREELDMVGQGRLDGAFCDYTDQEKQQFLEKLRSIGVVNIEMEATLFAAMCHHAGIKGAVVCVTLLDRLKGDQITTPKSVMSEWQLHPQRVVLRFIQHRLAKTPSTP
ncbi:hypothetical protein HPB50_021697 [Hyalomma asiaticum]|uniref:Uncharacterized protein n=1 Tax=Hyalomma asiaticum TaxID=266040 RepID=A0ACB7T959_HYAAI|nr:hypothetical protein HPB50_021697 [Hyalomma asiaticum]